MPHVTAGEHNEPDPSQTDEEPTPIVGQAVNDEEAPKSPAGGEIFVDGEQHEWDAETEAAEREDAVEPCRQRRIEDVVLVQRHADDHEAGHLPQWARDEAPRLKVERHRDTVAHLAEPPRAVCFDLAR